LPARIVAKMNSLVDPDTIRALYDASRAGVSIDLIVRGICCLRPGVPGISDRITVRSIVDRFLEHSRIVYFENAHQPELYVGSADWMPRNFFRRIEVLFPVEDGGLRERIQDEILGVLLADNIKARVLAADGSYGPVRLRKGQARRRSQTEFMELALNGDRVTSPRAATKRKYPRVKLAPHPFKS
jgi:polyphosphate kinase